MNRNIDNVIDRCMEVVARLQSALSARSQDNINRYTKAYHHAFDSLREVIAEAVIDEPLQSRLTMLELQHRRMMRICQQSMVLTGEDLTLIEQGISKLKQSADVADGLSSGS